MRPKYKDMTFSNYISYCNICGIRPSHYTSMVKFRSFIEHLIKLKYYTTD